MQICSKKRLSVLAAVGGLLAFAVGASPAQAMPTSFTDSSFITLTESSTISFTFAGFSAADTDLMRLVFNGQVIFDNQTATIGQTVTTATLAAGTYQLSLNNTTNGTTYWSNPAMNPDGAHLAFSNNFADFNLGPVPAGAGPAPYYGWEDRPLQAGQTLDYNDLVFSVAVRAVPEPGSLMLLGGSLLALGAMRRRRQGQG
jgi:hypothetical protein